MGDDQSCDDQSCPILDVHARMQDAHRLWHEALDHYQKPNSFRTYLNSCIQELRNVTFILQKNKTDIPNFEDWYPTWQETLGEDEAAEWLVEARNEIVKEGDIEKKSKAHIKVLENYHSPPVIEQEIDPMQTLDEIAQKTRLKGLSEHTIQNGILCIERRWGTEAIMGWEILDALSHVFGILRELIIDAHIQCGYERKDAENCDGGYPFGDGHNPEPKVSKLPCMTAKENERTIYLKLRTGEKLEPETEKVELDENIESKLKERYGKLDFEGPEDEDWSRLKTLSEHFFKIGRQLLSADGYHNPHAMLIYPDDRVIPVPFMAEDRSEKYLLMKEISSMIERTGATGIIIITESWLAPMDNMEKTPERVESDARKEALWLEALNEYGEEYTWMTIFEREDGKIKFNDRTNLDESQAPILNPVRRTWGLEEI